jgi:hypothetical protein
MSIIEAISARARPNAIGLIDISYYGASRALDQPTQTGARYANDAHWTERA